MQLGKWTFRATDTTHLYFSGLKRGESTHVTLGVVCQRGGWARALKKAGSADDEESKRVGK